MKENKLKTGLWKTTSKNGKNYYKGSLEIEGKKYSVALFKNDNKTSEKSPDLTIMLDVMEKQVETNKVDEIFKDFSASVVYKNEKTPLDFDDELAF